MTDDKTTSLPVWSSRSFSEADTDVVLSLFSEEDFYFRTAHPDTRPQWEVLALVADDTHVLLADSVPVGLYALEPTGSEHWSQALLHLRLSASTPTEWWRAAYKEVERAIRWRREIVRLALWIGEYDLKGLAFARSLGLTEEGTLTRVTLHHGNRYGTVFFSRIWAPTS